jgi:hypothetical protein
MKRNTLWLILPVVAAAFISSCGDKESSTPKPTATFEITGEKITGSEIEAGSNILVTATATAGSENLKSVVFTVKVNNNPAIIVLDTAVTGKTFNLSVPTKALGSVGDEVEYTVRVNDANGSNASKSIKFSVIPKLNGLDGAANQRVFNFNAQGQDIAYDLVAGFGLQKTSAPIDQDIKDASPSSAEQWSKKWASGNQSTFCKVTANDWNNASNTQYLYNLWKANKSKLAATVDLAVNDIILVKSSQNVDFNLYLIKITSLTDLPAIGNHNDFAQFDVKGINYPK